MDEGIQLVAKNDEIGTVDSPLLLISIVGEQEVVAPVSNAEYATVSVSGGRRSALQYALAAATAITLAREFDAGINDARRIFGDYIETTPESMLNRLRVAGHNGSCHDAASAIKWGPGMRWNKCVHQMLGILFLAMIRWCC
jgi:hypothetical protein